MEEPDMTYAEVRTLLGEDAMRAAADLAESAPSFGPMQEARLAVLLRRDWPVSGFAAYVA